MKLTGTVVFSSGKQGDYDIFTLDLDTQEVRQLTSDPAWNDCPKWSPDGQRILFISNRTGSPEIWVMDKNGQNQTRLTQEDRWHNTPDWSSDGSRMVFCANYDGNIDIYTMNMDGTDRRQITNYEGMDFTPQFSPDGSMIIFTSKRSGNDDIWTYDLHSGRSVPLTDYPQKDYSPTYSPDGERIAFITGLIGQDGRENLEVYLMDKNGQNVERVSVNLGCERFVTWSPDGNYLLFTSAMPGAYSERFVILDVKTRAVKRMKYDRSAMELETRAIPQGGFLFKLLPTSLLRKFYPESYWGTERYPDWKL